MSITDWMHEHFGRPEEIAKEVFKHTGGCKFIVASYDGGNDEGGICTPVYLFGHVPADPHELTSEDYEKASHIEQYDHPLVEALDAVMRTKYGTWAGDFHAYGNLYVDVDAKRIWTSGTETQEVEASDTISVQL